MLEILLFGAGTDSLLRVAYSVPLLYLSVVGFIRISGKRSTSQMNNFDWIVTVALGSLVGSGIVSRNIGVLEAMLAIALLLVLQFLLTWSVRRSERLADLVKSAPRLLVHRGQVISEALEAERISERELMAAVREEGIADLCDVEMVVLETDASFSVIRKVPARLDTSTLRDIRGLG